MNLGTIRARCANWCADPDQTRFSGKYNDAINRAQEQFALDSKALFKDVTWTSADGQSEYDLPADFLYERWVKFDGGAIDPASRETLDVESGKTNWEATQGTPRRYIIDPEEAEKHLRLWPIPQSGDANKTISMRYYPLPVALSSDSDTPLNSSALLAQFHMGLAAYAAWIILLDETVTPEIKSKRQDLLSIYNDAVTKAVDTFKNTASEPLHMRGSRAMR